MTFLLFNLVLSLPCTAYGQPVVRPIPFHVQEAPVYRLHLSYEHGPISLVKGGQQARSKYGTTRHIPVSHFLSHEETIRLALRWKDQGRETPAHGYILLWLPTRSDPTAAAAFPGSLARFGRAHHADAGGGRSRSASASHGSRPR